MTPYLPNIVGVLAKQDIEQAIDNGSLIINASKINLQACSYDMRIGTLFRDGQIVNQFHPEAHQQVIVEPGEIVSLFTLEEVNLPPDIMATAFAINEMSSRGFLVLNPGHVDPGFKGCLTVKALNLRKVPLTISLGTPILTVVFQVLQHGTTSPYNIISSRLERERDFNSRDVEQATKNLSELVSFGKDSIYPTKVEVREIIQQHWMSWLTLILTFIAALGSIIAVVLALIALQSNTQNTKTLNKATIEPKPVIFFYKYTLSRYI